MRNLCGAIVAAALMAVPVYAEAPSDVANPTEQESPVGLFDGKLFRDFFQLRPVAPKVAAEITYSRAWIDARASIAEKDRDAQWVCLTEALYFEARGESVRGQFAVAEVIMNRSEHTSFPSSVCGVIKQGTESGRKYQCQFTYNCDGIANRVREPDAFERVGKVARLVLDGAPAELTDGATHYHTKAVNPRWAQQFPRTTTIGVHHFYRMPTRVSKN